MGYTKLFSKLIASSIWNEDLVTKVVWITFLAMKDQNQIVEGSIGGIATLARVPLEDCRKAIQKLESPDRDDSSGVMDGRRIVKVDRGWFVVNGEDYRNSEDEDEKRARLAKYMRDYRQRKKEAESKESVSERNDLLDDVRQTEQNTTEQKNESARSSVSEAKYKAEIPPSLKTPTFLEAWGVWSEYKLDSPKGQKWNLSAQRLDLSLLERLGPQRACGAIYHTIRGQLDRLCEPFAENGNSASNGSHDHFVTREMISRHCERKHWNAKLVPIAWGKLASGRYYGTPVNDEQTFRDVMDTIYSDWRPD